MCSLTVRRLLPLFLCVLLIVSCRQNPLDIDISDIEGEPLELLRLDQDLFSLTRKNLGPKTEELKKKYGSFYDHYLMGFLSRGGTGDTNYASSVISFITDGDVSACHRHVQKAYPDERVREIAGRLSDCAKRFRHHFPSRALPTRFITCLSGWNYSFAYIDSALVVSLDMYLSDTSQFYRMLQYPAYQQKKMSADYILPDMARGWLLTEFDNDPAENTLLQHTVFYGKLYYAVNALLPETPDSLIIGYTGKQLEYCRQYEKNLWGYFAEKNRLYENNLNTIRELTMPLDGPFTSAISKECPPRIAMWVGWQIVKSYMTNNEGVTLDSLMAETDGQKILNKSRYRP